MRSLHEEAHAQLERAARDMKTFYDRNHLDISFSVGDQVLLQGENLKSNRPSKKLDHRRWGPFQITEKVGARAYRLDLPSTWRIHPVFHISRLHHYNPNPDTPPPPPPELVNGEYEHEIEEILDKRYDKRRKKTLYFVKWLGFPHDENEWLTEDELGHAQDLLNTFNEDS
ncbi:hypothetical protein EST38_g14023 [Candolleomyces aberdarensis]|uniref:Chromo domain-containing protein n=1 Tax=Candolleomyces aberdarensis TaxID=2316362 RepID=A0A4Q2D0S6_9AGAR|nr:hypothetical protein EST38_g14023 [Candolleomyces aberdarensis]